MKEYRERELAKSFVLGNEQAFNELYKAFSGKMYNWAKVYVVNSQDREEIVQNTFMKAWDKRNSFDCERKISTWLFTILNNECCNFVRNRKRRNSERILEQIAKTEWIQNFSPSSSLALSDIEKQENKKYLELLISKIPRKYGEVLEMIRQDLSNKEIAKILGVSEVTVRTRTHYGIQRIKKICKTTESRQNLLRKRL